MSHYSIISIYIYIYIYRMNTITQLQYIAYNIDVSSYNYSMITLWHFSTVNIMQCVEPLPGGNRLIRHVVMKEGFLICCQKHVPMDILGVVGPMWLLVASEPTHVFIVCMQVTAVCSVHHCMCGECDVALWYHVCSVGRGGDSCPWISLSLANHSTDRGVWCFALHSSLQRLSLITGD